ncbi:hypothetical protein JTT01_04710 [Clostridium botulinum]|nr:hypothetical protein [Clostridium botulinum]MCS4463799.1 hypothetical protein [Clostridium botulinum]MCS4465778.1 hypothetical protein [Clostridium botulinum]
MYNLERVYVISVTVNNAINNIDFYSNVYITTSYEGISKSEESTILVDSS